MNLENKFYAMFLGCAIGDTLGMPVESWTKDEIEKYYGRVIYSIQPKYLRTWKDSSKRSEGMIFPVEDAEKNNYTRVIQNKGEYTDDTILTLAIAESIVRKKGFDLDDVAKAHLEAYDSCKLSDGRYTGGFGSTTIKALDNLRNGVSPKNSGVDGPGVGPAMKISPIAMYSVNLTSNLDYAEDVSRMTHTDNRSIAGGIIQAHALEYLIHNDNKNQFLRNIACISRFAEHIPGSTKTIEPSISISEKLNWIKNNRNADVSQAYDVLKNGGAAWESHPFAIFMFQKYWNNPIEGLIETVNYGGDADTTGAIYGTLVGARFGNIFPENLYSAIDSDKIDRMKYLAKEMYNLVKN